MNEDSVIEFTPPAGTVDEKSMEGEAMVNWKKKDDGTYCIVSFEGKPIGESERSERPTADEQLESMAEPAEPGY